MTTQTQPTINLTTLTEFITAHLSPDVTINVAQDKLESYGYIVFRFSQPLHGFRNIKFIPDSSYWYVRVTPVYSNHCMDEESESIDLYNVWEWLKWRIPSIFPQVEQEKTADDLAWEEACRADDEVWQNGQAKLIEQIVEARDRASAEIQTEKVETSSITQDQLDTYWFAWRNINTDTPFISFVALLYPLTKLDTLEVIRYELKKSKVNS